MTTQGAEGTAQDSEAEVGCRGVKHCGVPSDLGGEPLVGTSPKLLALPVLLLLYDLRMCSSDQSIHLKEPEGPARGNEGAPQHADGKHSSGTAVLTGGAEGLCEVTAVMGGRSRVCTLRVLTFPLPGPGPFPCPCWPEAKISE